jgi:hypothetical protein
MQCVDSLRWVLRGTWIRGGFANGIGKWLLQELGSRVQDRAEKTKMQVPLCLKTEKQVVPGTLDGFYQHGLEALRIQSVGALTGLKKRKPCEFQGFLSLFQYLQLKVSGGSVFGFDFEVVLTGCQGGVPFHRVERCATRVLYLLAKHLLSFLVVESEGIAASLLLH